MDGTCGPSEEEKNKQFVGGGGGGLGGRDGMAGGPCGIYGWWVLGLGQSALGCPLALHSPR